MGIDPAARGLPSTAHVSLHEAGQIARSSWSETGAANSARGLESGTPRALGSRASRGAAASQRSYEPHTVIRSSGVADPDQWDGMLNRLGAKYNVPPLLLKAVMLAESGGRPDAVGDDGHSVGLFQLHDQGYGHGMGDARYDPEVNAERATRGLAEAWHAGQRAGYGGEFAVRAAYDYSFNPGGGFAYQGDSVVRYYNALLADQGLPTLA
jgi:hypothetical protein